MGNLGCLSVTDLIVPVSRDNAGSLIRDNVGPIRQVPPVR